MRRSQRKGTIAKNFAEGCIHLRRNRLWAMGEKLAKDNILHSHAIQDPRILIRSDEPRRGAIMLYDELREKIMRLQVGAFLV
jgi:hypothetical protein